VVVLGKTEQSRVQPFAGLVLRFKRVGMFWKTERTGAAQADAGPAIVTRQARQRCTSAKRVNEPRIGANFYAVRDASAERVNNDERQVGTELDHVAAEQRVVLRNRRAGLQAGVKNF